jgi:hypothetical protein
VFAKFSTIPSVNALSTGLVALAGREPQAVQDLQYKQTVPSSVSAADTARRMGRRMTLVEWWVPGAMALVGLILLVMGLIGWRRAARRGGDDAPAEPLRPAAAPERETQLV